ncbi:MAG: YybH family protein [Pseudonocardia sp.]
MVSEVDAFLADMLPRQVGAGRKLHHGDPEPFRAMWSRRDPVSLLGAADPLKTGWDEVKNAFDWVASHFSDSTDYRFELIAAGASGDLAYTTGWEHNSVSINGKPTTYTLRATHVYRREDGEWKIVHRHGDHPPADQSFSDLSSRSAPPAPGAGSPS